MQTPVAGDLSGTRSAAERSSGDFLCDCGHREEVESGWDGAGCPGKPKYLIWLPSSDNEPLKEILE